MERVSLAAMSGIATTHFMHPAYLSSREPLALYARRPSHRAHSCHRDYLFDPAALPPTVTRERQRVLESIEPCARKGVAKHQGWNDCLGDLRADPRSASRALVAPDGVTQHRLHLVIDLPAGQPGCEFWRGDDGAWDKRPRSVLEVP